MTCRLSYQVRTAKPEHIFRFHQARPQQGHATAHRNRRAGHSGPIKPSLSLMHTRALFGTCNFIAGASAKGDAPKTAYRTCTRALCTPWKSRSYSSSYHSSVTKTKHLLCRTQTDERAGSAQESSRREKTGSPGATQRLSARCSPA